MGQLPGGNPGHSNLHGLLHSPRPGPLEGGEDNTSCPAAFAVVAGPVMAAARLAGRLGSAAALVVAAGLAIGVGGCIGAATRTAQGFAAMLQAGLNVAVLALVILGVGALLYGLVPRSPCWSVTPWSCGRSWSRSSGRPIGEPLASRHSSTVHLGPVPATSLNWSAIAWLTRTA